MRAFFFLQDFIFADLSGDFSLQIFEFPFQGFQHCLTAGFNKVTHSRILKSVFFRRTVRYQIQTPPHELLEKFLFRVQRCQWLGALSVTLRVMRNRFRIHRICFAPFSPRFGMVVDP